MKKFLALFLVAFSLHCFGASTISPSVMPNGYAQHIFSQSLSINSNLKPFTWLVYGGTLPPGLYFQPNSTNMATIAGTPTTTGVYSFSVSCTDKNGTVTRVYYKDTITYNYLTVADMTTLWSRSVPTAPYGFDTWNSLLNISDTISGIGSIVVTTNTVSTIIDDDWVDEPFNATNFSATVGTTTVTPAWNVDNADQINYHYKKIGKTLFIKGSFATTTIVGAPQLLNIKIPGGYSSINNGGNNGDAVDGLYTPGSGIGVVVGLETPGMTDSWITIFNLDGSAFTAGVDNTGFAFSTFIIIQ